MAGEPQAEFARAKLNLTLHVTVRRPDGYHLLESLVAFAGVGDRLIAEPARGLSLTLDGPFGQALSSGADNLVLHAAEALAAGRPLGAALYLEKELPVASGIGGGSSDAAATLRLLSRLWDVPVPDRLALRLGADVPVCLAQPRPMLMRGIGERLSLAPPLPRAWVVLVNPGIAVPTGRVFEELDIGGTLPPTPVPDRFRAFNDLAGWLRRGINDLEAPARRLCPVIDEVLAALGPASVARMSGSGATCFGLLERGTEAEALAERIRRARPAWWIASAPLARPFSD